MQQRSYLKIEFGDKVITHGFPLDAAEEAFAIADDRKSGLLKLFLISMFNEK